MLCLFQKVGLSPKELLARLLIVCFRKLFTDQLQGWENNRLNFCNAVENLVQIIS